MGRIGEFEVSDRLLSDGLSQGVRLLEIQRGNVVWRVIPTRGMGIWNAQIGETRFGWDSPISGPVHPCFVDLCEPSGLGWLDGFDELLVRCGLGSNGAPEFDERGILKHPLHGHIANLPARDIKVWWDSAAGDLVVSGVVEEARFHFQKLRMITEYRWSASEATTIRIQDTVENYGGQSAEFQLLYHCNFGKPLLQPGSVLRTSVHEVVPRDEHSARQSSRWAEFVPPASEPEQVYFCRPAAIEGSICSALLASTDRSCGARLSYSTEQLPCFTLWKNQAAYSDGYVAGLEPGTNFPNAYGFEKSQGRTVSLTAGASCQFEVRLDLLVGKGAAEKAISALGTASEPRVHTCPQPGFSP